MTEQEQIEYNRLKEQNEYLIKWYDYFEREENSKLNVNNFHSIICGMPRAKLIQIISEDEPITITFERDCITKSFFLIVKNFKAEWKILTPYLEMPLGSNSFRMKNAENNQKTLKFWANTLMENIKYFAKFSKINVTINVIIPCYYKVSMWYFTPFANNDKNAYVSSYLKNEYPTEYEEVKNYLSNKGYNVETAD